MKIASNVTVRAVASSYAMQASWVLPLAHAHALTSPVHFSERKMSKVSAFWQLLRDSFCASIGLKKLRV
jgi:hypothetical protein